MVNIPRRIFVVEDELPLLEIIVRYCQKAGFETLSARTVDEAIGLFQELETVDLRPAMPDAVWLDHFLPEKNGDEFVKFLRASSTFSDVPIFLVTNAVEGEITNWYLRAGIRQVYSKTMYTPSKIIADIDLYLQRSPTDPSVPPQPAA